MTVNTGNQREDSDDDDDNNLGYSEWSTFIQTIVDSTAPQTLVKLVLNNNTYPDLSNCSSSLKSLVWVGYPWKIDDNYHSIEDSTFKHEKLYSLLNQVGLSLKELKLSANHPSDDDEITSEEILEHSQLTLFRLPKVFPNLISFENKHITIFPIFPWPFEKFPKLCHLTLYQNNDLDVELLKEKEGVGTVERLLDCWNLDEKKFDQVTFLQLDCIRDRKKYLDAEHFTRIFPNLKEFKLKVDLLLYETILEKYTSLEAVLEPWARFKIPKIKHSLTLPKQEDFVVLTKVFKTIIDSGADSPIDGKFKKNI